MERMAQVELRVAQIQHDNLLDVQNFIERRRIRILEMEWVDGYDLDHAAGAGRCWSGPARRVSQQPLGLHQQRDRHGRTESRTRLKPGMAVAIIRECLAGLAALHREEIVHGDIKPSNIMVKRTGNAKIIDIGSAIDLNNMPQHEDLHAAVRGAGNARSRRDHAAVATWRAWATCWSRCWPAGRCSRASTNYAKLLEAKRTLPQRLHKILPREVTHSELLMTICRRLTAPDPMLRYATAEQADTGSEGLAEFQRTLVRGDLASEYENELRVWLEELD